MANLVVTYVLWLFGGILGLHHVYLNRPRHCFIWFVTWGGMVLGWLGEVAQIQAYVDEANETAEFKKRIKEIKKEHKSPELTVGFLGFSMLIGHQLANVAVSSIPDTYIQETWYGPYLAHLLSAFGGSVGVYLVANMGPQKSPFWIPFLAAACTCPASYFLFHQRPVVNLICIMAAGYVSSEYSEWDKKKKPRDIVDYVKIWGAVLLGLCVYGTMWSSNLYHNHRVSTLNGTRIPLREAAANFMKMQPWDEATDAMWDVVPCLKMYPYDTCMNLFVSRLTELSDPGKDAWALEVLGFEMFPPEKEINMRCRKLSKKHHPDRMRKKETEEQEEAKKRFMDIQKACSTLSKMKINRERKSTWSENTQQETVVSHEDILNDIDSNGDSFDQSEDNENDGLNDCADSEEDIRTADDNDRECVDDSGETGNDGEDIKYDCDVDDKEDNDESDKTEKYTKGDNSGGTCGDKKCLNEGS